MLLKNFKLNVSLLLVNIGPRAQEEETINTGWMFMTNAEHMRNGAEGKVQVQLINEVVN